MDIEVLLESFDGAFAPNTLRAYRNLLITGVIKEFSKLIKANYSTAKHPLQNYLLSTDKHR